MLRDTKLFKEGLKSYYYGSADIWVSLTTSMTLLQQKVTVAYSTLSIVETGYFRARDYTSPRINEQTIPHK